jgi:hypothetical protein
MVLQNTYLNEMSQCHILDRVFFGADVKLMNIMSCRCVNIGPGYFFAKNSTKSIVSSYGFIVTSTEEF